jgi:enoyl-CoA hydratase
LEVFLFYLTGNINDKAKAMSIRIETQDNIFTVIIDRPDVRNCIDTATAKALADAFREFDQDEQFDVAVLCGSGNTFCAGWDLKAGVNLDQAQIDLLAKQSDGPLGPSRMLLSKPVIAAISGYAVAGGLELALWCDLRVMEETAVAGVFCRRFGVPLIDGGTVRLPRLIGMSHAMDLILTGRPVDAVEAKQIGLANRIVPEGQSRQAAEALAREIAKFPQACMRSDRLSAYEQWGGQLDEALQDEFKRGLQVVQAGSALSGAKAFTEGSGRHGKFK